MTEQEYKNEIDFIFNRFPSYQKVGKMAYKPGIESMQQLDEMLGHPHRKFKSIHIAGTNGKGSTSHMLASALMRGKLRIGLYTSPHLVDFRERIKINGEMISKEFVYTFLKTYKNKFIELGASFFEITTALAFAYFAEQKVDIAVIECGLGGRLDSTNILTPELSIITNIGLDHCEHLGFTYPEVAREKAGIIKPGVPVVIGERGGKYPDISFVANIFMEKAELENAPLFFAEDIAANNPLLMNINREKMDLQGYCQDKNIKTVCTALTILQGLLDNRDNLSTTNFVAGIENAARDTGLRGRWEKLNTSPDIFCDTGHNAHGFQLLGKQISAAAAKKRNLYMIFGVVADKDIESIISFLPNHYAQGKQAYYYFINASGQRALKSNLLAEKMTDNGFIGEAVLAPDGESSVKEGIKRVLKVASHDDFIFIGGSTFVVAEILDVFSK